MIVFIYITFECLNLYLKYDSTLKCGEDTNNYKKYAAMMEKIKKIPYGESDYGKIIRENMYYIDKTRFIHEIERLPNYLFLIRPRSFGKSLWINLLQYGLL